MLLGNMGPDQTVPPFNEGDAHRLAYHLSATSEEFLLLTETTSSMNDVFEIVEDSDVEHGDDVRAGPPLTEDIVQPIRATEEAKQEMEGIRSQCLLNLTNQAQLTAIGISGLNESG